MKYIARPHPHHRLRRRVTLTTGPSKRVQQHFAEECDINTIVRTANKNGRLPDMIKMNPRYGDFSDALSFQEALDVVNLAHEQFSALPSHVREKFLNDPARFLAFVEDPKTPANELVELGLAKKQPQPDAKNSDIVEAIKGLKNDAQLKTKTSPKKPQNDD